MLRHLTLRDFAVVSAVDLEFSEGLTVVSGETGAGKSLLVGALLALTGARADSGVVRHGATRAELAAGFDLADAPRAREWLSGNDLDEGSECQLRRIIRADGGSRAWINGRPATLGQLSELGERLLEIHGQHEHQALLGRDHQLGLLDDFGRHEAPRAAVADLARQWQAVDRELAEMSARGDVADRIALLEHQLADLGREDLDPAGVDALVAGHRRQAHAASLLAAYDAAIGRLAGDDGPELSRQLAQLEGELARQLDHEPRLADAIALVESARIQLDEATHLLERWRDDLDADPAALASAEARLSRLHELGRRHRVPLEGLHARRESLAAELESLRGADEQAAALALHAERLAAEWRQAASVLGEHRARAAARLGASVSGLMGELGMGGGVFAVELAPVEGGRPHPAGAERCEFLVSANPGQPPRPLRTVASGGELARISLAIEVAALGLDAVPTMVFDEVDSGIGGAVAEVVGQKLRALGRARQVLCVTHLPQVAAQGHHQFRVAKSVQGDGTHSQVALLSPAERLEELARMLGGVDVSRESRANARRMLSTAQAG